MNKNTNSKITGEIYDVTWYATRIATTRTTWNVIYNATGTVVWNAAYDVIWNRTNVAMFEFLYEL